MDVYYSEVRELLRQHPAAKLLRAGQAALIISFLDEVFVSGGYTSLPESELELKLTDLIERINDGRVTEEVKREPKALIKDWCSERQQFLRRFTKADSSEFFYEITPQAQKAVSFVISLHNYRYVGTESRLISILELLKQLTLQRDGSRQEEYLQELIRKRDELDKQIEEVRSGQGRFLSREQFYDRFQQFESLARTLTADLREVEYNLRSLYREIRTLIETGEGPKAEVLEGYFDKSDLISSSEQGISARAFDRLLLSAESRELLFSMLSDLYGSGALSGFTFDPRIKNLYRDLLRHSELINEQIARQDKELRLFINTGRFSASAGLQRACRKVMALIKEHPELLRDSSTVFSFESPSVQPGLPFERPLFSIPREENFDSSRIEQGEDSSLTEDDLSDIPLVDKSLLRSHLLAQLTQNGTVSLKEITDLYGLEYGADELLAYLELAYEEFKVHKSETEHERISYTRAWGEQELLRSEFKLDRTLISLSAPGEMGADDSAVETAEDKFPFLQQDGPDIPDNPDNNDDGHTVCAGAAAVKGSLADDKSDRRDRDN